MPQEAAVDPALVYTPGLLVAGTVYVRLPELPLQLEIIQTNVNQSCRYACSPRHLPQSLALAKPGLSSLKWYTDATISGWHYFSIRATQGQLLFIYSKHFY